MAYFWSKFQISSLCKAKDRTPFLRGPTIFQSAIKDNVKFFWSRKPKEPIQYGSGNCGKPPIQRMEPCTGNPSKCLGDKSGGKSKKSRKRSNSLKEAESADEEESSIKRGKFKEEDLTWWEYIFGPNPKKFWPHPCTCRLAHRQKKKIRSMDPRLCDPRYKETGGDVFLYTEQIKQCRRSCMEPQPKPPPSFKIPKAVLFKLVANSTQRVPFHEVDDKSGEGCKNSPLLKLPYEIPFEELRPSEIRRNMFTCKTGIKTEDIPLPSRGEANCLRKPSIVQQVDVHEEVKFLNDNIEKPPEKKFKFPPVGGKRSRVEQLKLLVQEKNNSQCLHPVP